jgi:hypothetical protein
VLEGLEARGLEVVAEAAQLLRGDLVVVGPGALAGAARGAVAVDREMLARALQPAAEVVAGELLRLRGARGGEAEDDGQEGGEAADRTRMARAARLGQPLLASSARAELALLEPVEPHEPEVAALVGTLAPALGDGEELVAETEEGHARTAAAQLEGEQTPVEVERGVEIADLEREALSASSPST